MLASASSCDDTPEAFQDRKETTCPSPCIP
jgi:hypothetical protein